MELLFDLMTRYFGTGPALYQHYPFTSVAEIIWPVSFVASCWLLYRVEFGGLGEQATSRTVDSHQLGEEVNSTFVLMIAKTCFHLTGPVNSQNNRR
jgi:hypothetical protein